MREAIKERISTRTFQKKRLNKEEINEIKTILAHHEGMSGPFNNVFEFSFNLNNLNDIDGKKIGTYGFIKHPPAYIGGVCENNMQTLIDFGYVMEHVILSLTKKNFDTCWMAGTFKRKDYRRQLDDNEIIPAISPVGYSAKKRSIMERIVRFGAGSKNRKPMSEIVLDPALKDGKDIKESNPFYSVFELIRQGPSASNKQPWRIVLDDNQIHMYLEPTKNYNKKLGFPVQALDIGIALCHLEIGLIEEDITFERIKKDDPFETDDIKYIISYKLG